MPRLKLFQSLHSLRLLERVYDSALVKWAYRSFVLSNFPAPQYCVELSRRCNAECVFCPHPVLKQLGQPQVNMNDSVFEKVLDFIESTRRSSISLTPSTGEILMNPRWDQYLQRILELNYVDHVHFHTNAVLFDKSNRKKLLELPHLKKLAISFSTGGVDAETYQLMFGKNFFLEVCKNINAFLAMLKRTCSHLPVSIDVRVPKTTETTIVQCRTVYNQCGYRHVFIKVGREYDLAHGVVGDDRLVWRKPIPPSRQKRPCNNLRDIRFTPNGEIRLCGVVVSELPGHDELKAGSVLDGDDMQRIEKRLSQIQSDWLEGRDIPYPCRGCTWYVAKLSSRPPLSGRTTVIET